MKEPWTVVRVFNLLLILICFLSVVVGALAFRGNTMDLRLAFWSIVGLLVAIALKP